MSSSDGKRNEAGGGGGRTSISAGPDGIRRDASVDLDVLGGEAGSQFRDFWYAFGAELLPSLTYFRFLVRSFTSPERNPQAGGGAKMQAKVERQQKMEKG